MHYKGSRGSNPCSKLSLGMQEFVRKGVYTATQNDTRDQNLRSSCLKTIHTMAQTKRENFKRSQSAMRPRSTLFEQPAHPRFGSKQKIQIQKPNYKLAQEIETEFTKPEAPKARSKTPELHNKIQKEKIERLLHYFGERKQTIRIKRKHEQQAKKQD